MRSLASNQPVAEGQFDLAVLNSVEFEAAGR